MADRKPFTQPRYATRGVVETLEPAVQQELWMMIEFLSRHPPTEQGVDYLQVFELQPETGQQNFNQSIIHTQEQPPYRATALVHAESPVSTKVFVIDDQTHCTMLLASEY